VLGKYKTVLDKALDEQTAVYFSDTYTKAGGARLGGVRMGKVGFSLQLTPGKTAKNRAYSLMRRDVDSLYTPYTSQGIRGAAAVTAGDIPRTVYDMYGGE
jgi:hypothetical protein